MQYTPLACSTALHNIKRKMPYDWDLNIYRGCEHACQYCFAIYSHDYLNDGRFFEQVYVKTNIVEKLEKQLRSASWKREVVNLGGVTDSYQPAEAEYKLMPEILKLLIKYKTPAIISTKSDLVLRDYELIDRLSRITYINIAATIVTTDEQVRQKLEPGASPIANRFAMLKEFRKTNASVGIHDMPIIPYLTDSAENMEALFSHAKEIGAHYLLPSPLNLRGKTRPLFFNFIQTEFPQIFPQIYSHFNTNGTDKAYKENFRQMLSRLRERYGISWNYGSQIKEKMYREPDLFSGLI